MNILLLRFGTTISNIFLLKNFICLVVDKTSVVVYFFYLTSLYNYIFILLRFRKNIFNIIFILSLANKIFS